MRWQQAMRLLEAAAALTTARGLLACVPFSRLAWATDERTMPAPDTAHRVLAVSRALAGARTRLPWSSTCLVQALAGHLMLRRRGVASTIVLGARKVDGRLDAHAWLIVGTEEPVCGGSFDDYAPLGCFVAWP